MDISTLSLPELKAFAFDEIRKIEIAQNNLRILNEKIELFPKDVEEGK